MPPRRRSLRTVLATALALAALAAPAAARGSRWHRVARAPRNLRVLMLDGGDGKHALVAAADQLAPAPGEMEPETGSAGGWVLRLDHGRWRATRILDGGRHADHLIGVWWIGDRLLAPSSNGHTGNGTIAASDDGVHWRGVETGDGDFELREGAIRAAGPLVVIGAGPMGVARSMDGGATWTEGPIDLACGDSPCWVGQVLATGGPHLIAFGAMTVMRSDDAGDHWQKVGDLAIDDASLLGDGADDGVLYAPGTAGDDLHPTLAASRDRGATWTLRALPAGAAPGTLAVAGADELYLGGAHLWRSTDGGATWRIEPVPAGSWGAAHATADSVYAVRISDQGDELFARARSVRP